MSRKIIATCDSETDPFEHGEDGLAVTDIKPFMWGYYNGKKFKKFDSTEEFVKDVRNRPWDFYAHNGGKFDYMFLIDHISESDIQEIKIINGRISKFKIGRATFYDSYNILPVPLSAMQKDEFDYGKMKKGVRQNHLAEIEQYLENDCVYLYDYIINLFEKRKKKITLASSAMAEFEELVDKMPKSNAEYHDKFKEFYFGGRVSPFEIGVIECKENEEIKIYDINSAYPTAMKYQHPYGTKMDVDVIALEELPENRSDIENCFIELLCESDGALPVRESDGGLQFPHEKRVYKITGWEYLAALDTDSIRDIKIITVWAFFDCRDFSAYVDKFYAEKLDAEQSGDKRQRLLAKLYLNSCYGKFAQDERNYKEYKIVSAEDAHLHKLYGTIDGLIVDEEYEEEREVDESHRVYWDLTREFPNGLELIEAPVNKIVTEDGETQNRHEFYNIATAASITGWVRAYMWRSLCSVERPLYCDTDSIACFNGDKLQLGDELGQWDCELDKVYKMAIAGKKLYAAFSSNKDKDGETITKTACKGVRLTGEEIEKVAKGDEVLYRGIAPTFGIKGTVKALQRYVNRKDRKEINVAKRKLFDKKREKELQRAAKRVE